MSGYCTVVLWGRLREELPQADCSISGGGKNEGWVREDNTTDLVLVKSNILRPCQRLQSLGLHRLHAPLERPRAYTPPFLYAKPRIDCVCRKGELSGDHCGRKAIQ